MANKNITYVDHLDEDRPIPKQEFVCISFLSPEGIMNCSVRGLKIRGVYATRQDADRRAAELQKEDPLFHVFVGEVGKWLPWDPDPNDQEDQIYNEKKLNDLMAGYKDNLKKKAEMEAERKAEMRKNGQSDADLVQKPTHPKGSTEDRLRKKYEKQQREKEKAISTEKLKTIEKSEIDTKTLVQKTEIEMQIDEEMKELEEQEKIAKQERDALKSIQKTVDSEDTLSVEAKLAKLKAEYSKLK